MLNNCRHQTRRITAQNLRTLHAAKRKRNWGKTERGEMFGSLRSMCVTKRDGERSAYVMSGRTASDVRAISSMCVRVDEAHGRLVCGMCSWYPGWQKAPKRPIKQNRRESATCQRNYGLDARQRCANWALSCLRSPIPSNSPPPCSLPLGRPDSQKVKGETLKT